MPIVKNKNKNEYKIIACDNYFIFLLYFKIWKNILWIHKENHNNISELKVLTFLQKIINHISLIPNLQK